MPDVRQLITTAAVAVLAIAGYQALHGASSAPAAAAPKAGGMLQPFMRFTGSGSTTMRPDQGTISFSTHGTGATLVAAQNEASRSMRTLIRALRADGVARSDMRTDGFAADQSLSVTVRDLKHTGKLLADGTAAGAYSVYGVDFSLGNQHAAYASALRFAVRDARAKADAAAAAAGLHVTGVVSVNEAQQQVYPDYGRFAAAVPQAAQSDVVPVKHGTQKVSANVTVVFAYAS
jgi:uncharacterized protein